MTDTTTPVQHTFPATFEGMVDLYVKLRDRIKEADEAHKTKTAPAKDYLESLNGHILAALNTAGGDSIKTQYGTAYRTEKKSASIADPILFRDFVIANQAWDIADWKANAPAVEGFNKQHGTLPPGVNYTTIFVVGVRRS